MSKNQKGYSLALVLIVPLILVALGLAGWLLWQGQKSTIEKTQLTIQRKQTLTSKLAVGLMEGKRSSVIIMLLIQM